MRVIKMTALEISGFLIEGVKIGVKIMEVKFNFFLYNLIDFSSIEIRLQQQK